MNDYTLYLGAESYEAFRSAFIRATEDWIIKNSKDRNKSTKTMEGNKLDIQVTNKSSAYGDSRIYRYLINSESVLRFDQIPYPECCGIAIIKNFSANSNISKSDFLDAMDKFILNIQENDRFSKILFYTNAESIGGQLFSQIPNVIILDSFKNNRSGNTLIGFEIDLPERKHKATAPSDDDGLFDRNFTSYLNEEMHIEGHSQRDVQTLGRESVGVRGVRVPSYFFSDRF